MNQILISKDIQDVTTIHAMLYALVKTHGENKIYLYMFVLSLYKCYTCPAPASSFWVICT